MINRNKIFSLLRRLEIKEDKDKKKIFSFNLKRLESEVKDFYTNIIFEELDYSEKDIADSILSNINSLIYSRSHLSNIFSQFNSAMHPETNKYIGHYQSKSEVYSKYIECFGILEGTLDKISEKMQRIEANSRLRGVNPGMASYDNANSSHGVLNEFRQKLIFMMETMVINSIENAIDKFEHPKEIIKDKGEKLVIMQDEEYFFFRLFYELFQIVITEGNMHRVAVKEGKSTSLNKTDFSTLIDNDPHEVRTKKFEVKDNNQDFMNMFKDPFEGGENDAGSNIQLEQSY